MSSKEQTNRPPANLQEELGKKNPFDIPQEEAYLNLMRTADALSGQVRCLLAQYDLSEPLYNTLRIVAARGADGIPSQSIARDMVCRSPDMTSLVDKLCKAGLVERARCMKDRRLVYVRITPRGQETLRKIRKPAVELLQSMFSELSPKQLSTLNTLLFAARRTEKSELPAGE